MTANSRGEATDVTGHVSRDVQASDDPARILERLGGDLLRRHLARVRRHPLKLLTLPYSWLMAHRLRRAARAIATAAGGLDGDSRIMQAVHVAVQAGRYDDRLALVVLESITRAVVAFDHRALEIWRDFAQSSPTPIARWMRLRAAQQAGAWDEAAGEGRALAANSQLSPRSRRQLLSEPAMQLEVRDLVSNPAPRPSWPIPGRIAYVAASSLPYLTVGYTTRTHGVACGYRTIGYDVHVVTRPPFPLNVRPDLVATEVPEEEEVDGIPHHRLLAPRERHQPHGEYVRQAAAVLEAKLRSLRPEVVIAGSNHANSLPALIAARRLGLPFSYEVRGMWELSRASREPGYEQSADFAVTRLLETFVATHADKVLTLTAPMRNDLVARGVATEDIALMPNGIDPELVGSPPRDEALGAGLGLPRGVPVVGYIGSIVEYEGLTDLAAACASLAVRGMRCSLLIVGEEKPGAMGATPITAEIRRIFAAAGIADRLFMPGRVPFARVRSYYSLIDVAPITRRPYLVSEMVSPIKPVEALAMGKTLIVSDVEALVEFVQDGRTGLRFRKGDVADLARVLAQAIEAPALRETLGHNGMDFIRAERTWPRICERAATHIGIAPVRR